MLQHRTAWHGLLVASHAVCAVLRLLVFLSSCLSSIGVWLSIPINHACTESAYLGQRTQCSHTHRAFGPVLCCVGFQHCNVLPPLRGWLLCLHLWRQASVGCGCVHCTGTGHAPVSGLLFFCSRLFNLLDLEAPSVAVGLLACGQDSRPEAY